jgi:hypothetical protein
VLAVARRGDRPRTPGGGRRHGRHRGARDVGQDPRHRIATRAGAGVRVRAPHGRHRASVGDRADTRPGRPARRRATSGSSAVRSAGSTTASTVPRRKTALSPRTSSATACCSATTSRSTTWVPSPGRRSPTPWAWPGPEHRSTAPAPTSAGPP